MVRMGKNGKDGIEWEGWYRKGRMGRIVRMRIIGKGLCIYEYGWMGNMERGWY